MRLFALVSLASIVILAAAVRFHNLGRADLWLDEQLEYHVASQPDTASLLRTAMDSGPVGPIGYLCDALSLRVFGASRWAMRFSSALLGVGSVAAVYFLGRRWFSERAGLFAAALMSVSGLSVQFSREARPYSALVFASLLLALAFDGLFRTPWPFSSNAVKERGRVGFTFSIIACELAALLIALIHPLSMLVCAGLAFGALAAWALGAPPASVQKAGDGAAPAVRWPALFAIALGCLAAGSGIAYAVWWRNVANVPFMPPESPGSLAYELLDIYKALLGGYWGAASYAIAAAFVIGAIAAARKSSRSRWGLCLSGVLGALGAVPVVISHARNMNVLPRYSIFAVPFLLLIAAAGIDFIWSRIAKERDEESRPATFFAAPLLALLLLLSMRLQGRSLYDLEAKKHTDPHYPGLDVEK